MGHDRLVENGAHNESIWFATIFARAVGTAGFAC